MKEDLDYEENIVFLYVIELIEKWKNKNKRLHTKFSSEEYREHHNDIEEKLSDLKNLFLHHLKLGNYANIGRQLIFHLYELEFDLQAHSKIEEKILIPLIRRLENEVNE